MATAVENIAETEKQSNATGHSDGNGFDTGYSTSSQQSFEETISIDKMIEPLASDNAIAQSQNENNEKENNSPISLSVNDCKENKNNDITIELPKKKTKKKYINFLDSDSESEDDFISSLLNKSNAEESSSSSQTETKELDISKLGKSSRRMIDSESEDEDTVNVLKMSNIRDKNHYNEGKRYRTLVDSDSEDENASKPNQMSNEASEEKADSEDDTTVKTKKQKISSIVDLTSDEEAGSEDSTVKNKKGSSNRSKKPKVDKKISKSKISSLIDTDSEDDDKHNNDDQTPQDEQHEDERNLSNKTEKPAKKRSGSIRASKDEAMRQIHSETQRLIRSSEVSLPYHRPKQRSLQEFLNRKKFIPTLPEGLSTAAKVKMSSEIVSKVLEEKEKEAELFYKSSDSEDEVTIDPEPVNPVNENETLSLAAPIPHLNIEDTQKIFNNDIQNAHNKKEIIQQGSVDIGVPRKLFTEKTEDLTVNKSSEAELNSGEVLDSEDPRKKIKETKQGLKEVSVPRKLFGSDYEEIIVRSNSQESNSQESLVASQSSEIIEFNPEHAHSSTQLNVLNLFTASDKAVTKSKLESILSDEVESKLNTTARNTIVKENTEFVNISETPFISNKEIAKLNEKLKTSTQNVVSSENFNDDDNSGDSESLDGHVLGLPPPDFDIADNILSIKKKLSSTACPKLRGTPGMFIDLSDDVKPNSEGVQSLVDRLIRHSTTSKSTQLRSPVIVLHTEKTADGLKVVEQILPYKLPASENFNDKELSKPGAKYLRLKNELMEKMAKKRGEEWKLKEQQEKDENLEDDEEIEDESDIEDDEELLHEEFQVSGESEPEEDDMKSVKKKKKREPHDFADEEAEVSGEEENDDEDEEMESNDDDVDDEDEGEEDNKDNKKIIDEDDDTRDIMSDVEYEKINEPKKLTRILKAFDDDSNSSPEISLTNEIDSRNRLLERTKTDIDIFAPDDGNDGWLSDTDSEIPPSQIMQRDPIDGSSQVCKTPLTALNILRFVSPITQLTAFNSCTDSPKDDRFALIDTPGSKLRIVDSSVEKTPRETKSPFNSEKKNSIQKKLFEDPAGTVDDEELMNLCSGKFTGMENVDERIDSQIKESEGQSLGLGSCLFLSRALDSQTDEKINVTIVDDNSQDIKLNFDSDTEDSCDKIIGKESTIKSKIPWTNSKIDSSSDEEELREKQNDVKDRRKKLTKKKVKKLELSDDEDENNLSSEEEEDCNIVENDNEDKYVDYDSEENEVVMVPKKDIKKVAAGFLDEEAELSESEWGSADEDEKGLDKLEFEEGDAEDIDENQMRDQIGKMHMRQVLDDDQREVRMLQELLFDDGDLHTEGSGRERQFKWKNIDNLGDDDKLGPLTDDVDENGDVIEEENDLEWRKQRLEREKFLEDKMKNSTDTANEELESDSQIFKLGLKALKKSKTMHNSQIDLDGASIKKPLVPRTVIDLCGSPSLVQKSSILKKAARGSFLARGDECLARLAVHIKQTETTITSRKNPRNFVFTHISPSVNDIANNEQRDETMENGDSPADAKAKKRKPPAGVTPRTTKKAKIEVTRSTGKKLF